MTKLPGAIADARIVGERFVHCQRQQNPEGRMPFMNHIRELRNRVVKIALALAAGMTAGFIFFDQAWHVIERPLCAATIRGHSGCHTPGINELVLNGPLDPFYPRVKVALIVGVILSSPIWLPDLGVRRARLARQGKAVELHFPRCGHPPVRRRHHAVLPVAGPVSALPARPDARWRAGRDPGRPVHELHDGDDVGLRAGVRGAVLLVMLNLAGVLTDERFRKWRVLIFGVFPIAGMANPSPDPFTMLILGGACALLVEAAEAMVWSHDWRRARLHPVPSTDLADDELSRLQSDGRGKG
jgi:sec-independent protein translocase protein TatC